MTPSEQALIDTVRSLRPRQVQLTQALVRIPTVNPYSGDDSAAIETAGQTWIAERFREAGAEVDHVPVPSDVYARGGMIGPANRRWDQRRNVIARWTLGDGAGPTVLLNSHMDTVGTAGMSIDPFDPVIRDGQMFGRGTSDTKGNLILGLIAVEALRRHGADLRGRVVFESVVDEECNGAGAGTLACCLAGVRGDIALCLDGSYGELHNGCNGIGTARVMVQGQAGHSSHGHSVNAIDKAIAVKHAIDRFGKAYAAKHPSCQFNVGVFRAGTLPAVVPGEAELQINLNYDVSDAEEAERTTGKFGGSLFRGRFEQTIAALANEDPWFRQKPPQVSWIKDLYPFRSPGADPLTATALDAVSDVFGQRLTPRPMSAWFDAAHISRQLGIPVLGLAAGTPGCAHSSAEHVILADLYRVAEAVALALYRLLQPSEGSKE